MSIVLSLFAGFVPIVILIAVIAAIATSRRSRDEAADDADDEPGIGTVRRLFLYGLALVALSFAASGVAMLIGGALDSAFGTLVVADRNRGLAIALSFTVVGGPAWLLLAFAAQRSLAAHAVELRSRARRLYFAIARGIALSIVVANAISVGRFLVGVRDFDGAAWGWLIAWGGAWLVHQRLAGMESPQTAMTRLMDRIYGYFGSAFGFFVIAVGAVMLLEAPGRSAYDSAFRSSLVTRPWTEDIRAAAVVLAVGAAVWWWHWLRALVVRDRLTTLWQTYVFLIGVVTGLGMVVVPAARLLHAALQWMWGDPSSATAAEHFALVPGSVATLIVGATIWGYHRAVIAEAASAAPAPAPPRGPERVYRYLVAAVGLLTASLGLVILLTAEVDALAEPAVDLVYGAGWWRNRIIAAVTLLAVGIPLWGRYWLVSQRAVAHPTPGDDERASQSRRVFTFATIGIALVALLISLTIVLFRVFEAVLDASLSRMLLRDAREAIATVLTAGAVAVYYWLVLREDQAARESLAPAVGPARRRDVMLLAPAGGDALARVLGEIDGVRVRAWRRLDAGAAAPALSAEQIAALRDAIAASDADRLAVIVGGDGYELVPYSE